MRQSAAAFLLFVHDDVWLEDLFLADRILEGLTTYEVIGVAGNRRRLSNQWGWPFKSSPPDQLPSFGIDTWDIPNLSGAVSRTGPTPWRRSCGSVMRRPRAKSWTVSCLGSGGQHWWRRRSTSTSGSTFTSTIWTSAGLLAARLCNRARGASQSRTPGMADTDRRSGSPVGRGIDSNGAIDPD